MGNQEQDHVMKALGQVIQEATAEAYGQKMGFCLLVFPLGEPGIADYISNGDRADMVECMREAANRFESGETVPVPIGRG